MADFLTAEDFYGLPVGGRPDHPAEWAVVNFWPESVPFAMPLGDSGLAVPVTCNYGRWIVVCPDPACGGAQMASETDPRFFCVACLNGLWGGRWHAIDWREDRSEVEDALRVRQPANRNALPQESVATLDAENGDHADDLAVFP